MHWETWKHHVRWETAIGRFARAAVDRIGLRVLCAGQGMLAWSMGRCSLCGWKPGMGAVSGNGHRCMGQGGRNCCDIETVRDKRRIERIQSALSKNARRVTP